MKKVLILCTGNSCRSIIAEALINAKMGDRLFAQSSGVKASGNVNSYAKKLLDEKGIWREQYHSKTLDTLINEPFDLVVTVCDHAHETCPVFPHPTPKMHVGFEDPDGKGYEAFEATYHEIEAILLPKIEEFFNPIAQQVVQTSTGVKINFTGAVAKNKIFTMVENCKTGQCACMSDTTKAKIANMNVTGEDGNVELTLSGEISKAEIEEALAKSKVLS